MATTSLRTRKKASNERTKERTNDHFPCNIINMFATSNTDPPLRTRTSCDRYKLPGDEFLQTVSRETEGRKQFFYADLHKAPHTNTNKDGTFTRSPTRWTDRFTLELANRQKSTRFQLLNINFQCHSKLQSWRYKLLLCITWLILHCL